MSAHTFSLQLGHAQPGVAPRHNLLRNTLLTLLVAAFVVVLVMATNVLVGQVTASMLVVAEPVFDFPTRELPPKWKWAPEPVRVEHMYSRKAWQLNDFIKPSDSGRRSGY
jgi:hypothetical protein